MHDSIKVKWSRYRPGVAQRVGRGVALLFHDRGTRSGWVVSSTPRPHFTPGKEAVPVLQVAGWASGPVWKGEKSRPHWDSIPDRPVRSQSLYLLSYPGHNLSSVHSTNTRNKHHLHRAIANLSCFQKGASYSGIRIFNNLPQSITSLRN